MPIPTPVNRPKWETESLKACPLKCRRADSPAVRPLKDRKADSPAAPAARLLKNPMASPSTLGVSNAAVFGANVSIIGFAGGFLSTGHNVQNYGVGANPFQPALGKDDVVELVAAVEGEVAYHPHMRGDGDAP